MRMIKSMLFILVALFALHGCAMLKQETIKNYENQSVPAGLSSVQVANTIVSAGQKRGWVMKKVRPGLIRGSINERDHYAAINIHYNRQGYDIMYADSKNLLAKNGKIHQNYNNWTDLLNQSIQMAFWEK